MSSAVSSPVTAGRGLWRWFVALVATIALVVSGSGLVVFAQSGDGQSQGPVFVPADMGFYLEARLDRPAGQDEALAQFMSAFPGFADPGSFDLTINELVAGLEAQAGISGLQGDLIGDVLTGEVGVALGDLGAAIGQGTDPTMLIGLALADAASVTAAVEAQTAGGSFTSSTYNDVTIYTDDTQSPPMSVAVDGDWLLIGTSTELVQSSIDTLAGTSPSLAASEAYTTAVSRLPTARLAAVYMDSAAMGDLVSGSMSMAGGSGMSLPTGDLAAMLPTSMVAALSAASDRLTLDVHVTPGAGTPTVAMGDSQLATHFPADTQLYLEVRNLGAAIEAGLNQLAASMPASADGTAGDSASQIAALFSDTGPIAAMFNGVPLPKLFDFVGDASLGAGLNADGLWLGIAGEVTDQTAAAARLTSLSTVLRMAMASMSDQGVSISTDTVGGVDVTTITLPLDQTMAQSGVPIPVGNTISFALDGDTLLVGLGDFVTTAIESDGSDSLATDPGYVDALAGDTTNAGVLYANVNSLVTVLDPMLQAMSPEWASISPYASALDRMIVVGTADDQAISSRISVIVNQ